MTDIELNAEIAKYKWYHTVPLTNAISTPGIEGFMGIVSWAADLAAKREMRTRTLLDVGCRDCYASLRAEQNGAVVDAIDNDISAGARDFLLPYFKSTINLQHLSLYDLDAAKKQYDLIQFFGVLYHLR
jgi:2-polyprenyl-3-methyl-5-hydroxy-6-metoxy-1,4-benzoquinol methylase